MKITYFCLFLVSSIAFAETSYRMDCTTPARHLTIEWQSGSEVLTINYEGADAADIQLMKENSVTRIVFDGQSEVLSCSQPFESLPIVNVNQPGPWSHYTIPKRVHCGPKNRVVFRMQCYARNPYLYSGGRRF